MANAHPSRFESACSPAASSDGDGRGRGRSELVLENLRDLVLRSFQVRLGFPVAGLDNRRGEGGVQGTYFGAIERLLVAAGAGHTAAACSSDRKRGRHGSYER